MTLLLPVDDLNQDFFHIQVYNVVYNADGGLVDYEKLRLRLISTGKFFVGDAVMMIEHMERTGIIEETGFHLYRRKDAHNGDGGKL